MNGDIRYDALSSTDVERHYRGDVQYCPEDEILFPTLTVEQTVEFAAKTRAPNKLAGIATSTTDYVKTVTNILITVLGLGHVRNTPVGNAAIRGVSGGQRKRVSICEVMATMSRIAAWDKYEVHYALPYRSDHELAAQHAVWTHPRHWSSHRPFALQQTCSI